MVKHAFPTPIFLKALGHRSLPQTIRLLTGDYVLERIFKHDFFAATGLYVRGDGHRVVLKMGRCTPILLWPGRWIGCWLVKRECRIYQKLADLPLVPKFRGRLGKYAFVHDFAAGSPLKKNQQVSDSFFTELEQIIALLHQRGMAYIDLEKPENIIVGEDGRPYLIDFQISWDGAELSWLPKKLVQFCTAILQEMDRYHLHKHLRRHRPDLLPPHQRDPSFGLPRHIQWHRRLVRPLQLIRRALLRRFDPQHHQNPK